MKKKTGVRNEEGAVLVVALIFLVLLTLLGISITTTSEIEIQIAGNERRYKMNLYRAEGAAMEAAQTMEEAAALDDEDYTWLIDYDTGLTKTRSDFLDDDTWWSASGQLAKVDSENKTRYIAVEQFIAGELDLEETPVHDYTVYGRRYDPDNPNRGRSVVKVGYRKAF